MAPQGKQGEVIYGFSPTTVNKLFSNPTGYILTCLNSCYPTSNCSITNRIDKQNRALTTRPICGSVGDISCDVLHHMSPWQQVIPEECLGGVIRTLDRTPIHFYLSTGHFPMPFSITVPHLMGLLAHSMAEEYQSTSSQFHRHVY